jgi:hypothetical protein
MLPRSLLVAMLVSTTLTGCATPERQADAAHYAPHIYRTGSNIPTKDYGAANIEVGKPSTANPLVRPGTSVLGTKPGQ